MNETARIAIFLSGNGSNAEAIVQYFKNNPTARVVAVLSNNANAYGLVRASQLDLPTLTFDRPTFRESETVLEWLKEKAVTHIVLAGFLWLVPDSLTRNFPGRIINIHPALLPKHGGKGMYGIKVHEAVKAAGDVETGITIHEVNEHYDEGKILFQAACAVEAEDTPEHIALKVQQLEHMHYPRVIEQWMLTTPA